MGCSQDYFSKNKNDIGSESLKSEIPQYTISDSLINYTKYFRYKNLNEFNLLEDSKKINTSKGEYLDETFNKLIIKKTNHLKFEIFDINKLSKEQKEQHFGYGYCYSFNNLKGGSQLFTFISHGAQDLSINGYICTDRDSLIFKVNGLASISGDIGIVIESRAVLKNDSVLTQYKIRYKVTDNNDNLIPEELIKYDTLKITNYVIRANGKIEIF